MPMLVLILWNSSVHCCYASTSPHPTLLHMFSALALLTAACTPLWDKLLQIWPDKGRAARPCRPGAADSRTAAVDGGKRCTAQPVGGKLYGFLLRAVSVQVSEALLLLLQI
jgi:hypothetical protein